MPTTYRLHVTPPQGEPYDFQFEGPEAIIGRASDSHLPLTDRFLSRHHARLFLADGDALTIEDLGSRNGTQINGNPVTQPTRVKLGDVITMCGSVITVHGPSTAGGQRISDPSLSDTDMSGQTLFRKVSDLLESSAHIEVGQADERSLRRYADRLRLLNEVHQALAGSMELDELLQLILERAFDHLRPEEGAIFLKNDKDGELRLAARRHAPGVRRQTLYSRSLIHEVTEKGVGALVYDVESDERFAQAHSILTSGVRSLVAAPLLDREGSLGMIVLDSRAAVRHFAEEDLELLVSLASVAAMRIRNVKLAEEAAARRVLEKEVELARRIQVALLPHDLPELDGYALHAGNRPSRTVSGDYYEVVTCKNGRCVVMLADVSGKGIAASLLTASLEALSAGPIEMGLPTDEICRQVNGRLHARTPPEKYATAFLASLDPATGGVEYTNAGHNPALLVRKGGEVEQLGATGTPIGLIPNVPYRKQHRVLEPGDTLVMYTDGVTEAANPMDEEYGTERLEDVCRQSRFAPVDDLVDAIENDLEAFCDGVPFSDDVTMVVVRREG